VMAIYPSLQEAAERRAKERQDEAAAELAKKVDAETRAMLRAAAEKDVRMATRQAEEMMPVAVHLGTGAGDSFSDDWLLHRLMHGNIIHRIDTVVGVTTNMFKLLEKDSGCVLAYSAAVKPLDRELRESEKRLIYRDYPPILRLLMAGRADLVACLVGELLESHKPLAVPDGYIPIGVDFLRSASEDQHLEFGGAWQDQLLNMQTPLHFEVLDELDRKTWLVGNFTWQTHLPDGLHRLMVFLPIVRHANITVTVNGRKVWDVADHSDKNFMSPEIEVPEVANGRIGIRVDCGKDPESGYRGGVRNIFILKKR